MPAPPVIAFTPVPLRRRADGWTADLQLRFIQGLSLGLTPGEAARAVGKNRQNAYALRKREGAESFAAAWDQVVARVRAARAEGARPVDRDGPAAGAPARRPLPSGPEAVAIAERGLRAVEGAPTLAAGRRALDEMLDALYGPKNDKGDNSDSGENPPLGSRNL